MKSFITSIILFIAIILATVINTVYVRDTVSTLEQLALSVSEGDSDGSDLEAFWNDHKDYIELTTSYRQIDEISNIIINLRNSYTFDDKQALQQNYVLLCNALDDILRYESFSITNIL